MTVGPLRDRGAAPPADLAGNATSLLDNVVTRRPETPSGSGDCQCLVRGAWLVPFPDRGGFTKSACGGPAAMPSSPQAPPATHCVTRDSRRRTAPASTRAASRASRVRSPVPASLLPGFVPPLPVPYALQIRAEGTYGYLVETTTDPFSSYVCRRTGLQPGPDHGGAAGVGSGCGPRRWRPGSRRCLAGCPGRGVAHGYAGRLLRSGHRCIQP